MSARICIGTSGWHYDHWNESFYPEGLSPGERLAFYADRFGGVEINNSFYQLPETDTIESWRDTVSGDFLFAVKASRYITHMKKLKDPQEPVDNFLERVRSLGSRLGPILFQLPPKWRCNPQRLRDFLAVLPGGQRYAFEFRDPSWFDDEVYRALEEAGAAFCIYDLAGRQSPKEVTADFVYVRLHGPGNAYEGSYSPQVLAGWAGAFATWSGQGWDIYCFFDNDQKGYAVTDAMRLQEMLDKGDAS